MTGTTEHFGLTKLGPGEGIHSGSGRFPSADRDVIDQQLYRFAQHRHTGEDASQNAPEGLATLTLGTAGTLPPGTTVRYKYTFVDPITGESTASPEETITTPDAVEDPAAPTSTLQSIGGTLEPGQYFYALSAYQGATTIETKATNALSVTIPPGSLTNQVELTLPAIPVGVDGYNVYRLGPSETRYSHIGTATTTDFVDAGLPSTSRTLPSVNATATANSVEIAIPLLPADNNWRIYRTFTADWSSSFLTEVIGPVTSYVDIGTGTTFGDSPAAGLDTGSPPKVNLTDAAEVQGVLPVANGGTGAATEEDARVNLGVEIGVDVQAHSTILDETTAPFTIEQETTLAELVIAVEQGSGGGGGGGDVDARQNLRLWQLEATVLGVTEDMSGWQGDAFLVGQDEIASNVGGFISRNADLDLGYAALRAADPDLVVLTTNPMLLTKVCDRVYFLAEMDAPGTEQGDLYEFTTDDVGVALTDIYRGVNVAGASMTFANEYVAVGLSGEIYYSTDGVVWTASTVPETWDVNDVYYDFSLDRWFAACDGGIMDSVDGGATWVVAVTGGNFNSISENIASDNLHFAGDGGAIQQRTSAGVYSVLTSPGAEDLNAIARGSSNYRAVFSNAGKLWYASTPSTWNALGPAEHGVTGDFQAAIYCPSYDSVDPDLWFRTIAVGAEGTGGFALASDNYTMATWTSATLTRPARAVALGSTMAVAVGDGGLVATSPDGLTWTEIDLGVTTDFTGVSYAGPSQGWLLSGADGSVMVSSLVHTPVFMEVKYEASLNGGSTWIPVTNGANTTFPDASHGDELVLRVTMERNEPTSEAHLYWFIGYAAGDGVAPVSMPLDGGDAASAFTDTVDGGSATTTDIEDEAIYDGGSA